VSGTADAVPLSSSTPQPPLCSINNLLRKSDSIYLLPVNLYGPRDDFDLETSHVIPALIRKCIEARKCGDDTVTVWGTGNPTREFLYVKDAVTGMLNATESYDRSIPVNLGSGEEVSIKELAEKIASLTGYDGDLIWDTSKPDGQPRRKLDTSKAREEFGWEASTTLTEGLRETIEWFETNHPSQHGQID